MNYTPARAIAEHMLLNLRSYCRRVEIAGSLRREKAVVGDIEVVAIPRIDEVRDMFGAVQSQRSLLDDFSWGVYGQVLKNGSRYKQIALSEGINLDLFIVLPPADWGVIYTIRTGPAEFSKWIVTQRFAGGALPSDCRVMDGHVVRGLIGVGEYLPMSEEIDFLNFLGIGWVEPCDRQAGLPLKLTGSDLDA